jgi:hypothetical protein
VTTEITHIKANKAEELASSFNCSVLTSSIGENTSPQVYIRWAIRLGHQEKNPSHVPSLYFPALG